MPPSSSDTAAAHAQRIALRHPSRSWWHWRTLARWGVALVLAAWSVLLVAWLVLHWWILPHLNDWRGEVAHRASLALGVPVQIGHIEVQSRGWVPAIRLDDVVLRDPAAGNREALRLPHVAAAISARSVLSLSLRFEQLLIDGAQLDVRRDRSGRIFVAGLPVDGNAGDARSGADWFFEQHEFAIRHGQVRWTDERLNAPPLALTEVDLVVRNGLKGHAMRLDATPPADWGARFSLRGNFHQPLLARSGDWQRWRGTVHADLPRADVSQLRRYVKLPFELSEGQGALRAWVDVDRGSATGATVDVALDTVALRLQRDLPALALQRVHGRLVARRDSTGVSLGAEHFTFTTAEGREWLPATLHVGWQQRQDVANAPVTGGDLRADRLDIGLMADIAGRLPVGDAVRKLLTRVAPQGRVQDLNARWDGPLDAPAHYQVQARLTGLSIAAGEVHEPHEIGRPGWRNADVTLQAGDAGGEATLAVRDGAMDFPGVFEQAEVPLDRFDAQLSWRIVRAKGAPAGAAPAIELKVKNARFANADAEGEVDATWHTGAGTGSGHGGRFPGILDLKGKLVRGTATSVARYLPLGIPEGTRRYVSHAVQAGEVDGAQFKVKGDLWDFPFGHVRDGEFRIAGHVKGVTLAYVPSENDTPPAWPAFTDVAGDLVFDRNSMEIHHAQGRSNGFELSEVQGGIRSFIDKPTLLIDGQGRGPLADALRYVNAAPVGDWLGGALKQATATGNSELKLALSIPLDEAAKSTVKGSVSLLGNDLRLRPDVPALLGTRARVDFTQKGFSLRGATARVLGGDAVIDGSQQADGAVRFTAQGTATADGMRRTTEVPALARMAASFTGQAPFKLALAFAKDRSEFSLSSPLTGLALDLPEPLRKPADTALPLRVQAQALPDGSGNDQLRIDVGNVAQAVYVRDVSGDSPRVLRGALAVQDVLPSPSPQVAANVNLQRFDADAWTELMQRWFPSDGAGAGAGDAGEHSGYVPRQLALRAKELRVDARRLTDVVAGVSALPDGDPGWRANVSAQQLSGYFEYRPAASSGAGRVFARLARLSLPPSEVESVESLLDQGPRSVPALDIVIDDFELRGKKLGKVEIEAVNQAGEGRAVGAPDWRLARFDLSVPEAHLQGSGRWSPDAAPGGRRRMVLDFNLDVSDSGALLQRLGTPGALKGGSGRLRGEVSWLGSPFTLDYPSMNGQLNLALDNGQFLKAGPGAARLLGVLSLQALPRRLVLDFRDVFQEGFAFDHVSGDVQIRNGVAHTNNFRMRGVQAAVLMDGQADIARETQSLRVVVVPEINAGTASLAYAAINPAVGLGTFLAQMFLRKPLIEASTREFHVTGSWDDPKVEQVAHKADEPLPGDEAAPAEAAAASAPRAQ